MNLVRSILLPQDHNEMLILAVDFVCLMIGLISLSYWISKYILIMTAVSITFTVIKKIYDFVKDFFSKKKE
jgi:hypothetical protein